MSVFAYAQHLPAMATDRQITLGEGATPVVRSRQIGPAVGADALYFKLESSNPTGSYKDRFAAMAVTDMHARGVAGCVATSSGNTGAALAAYCAAVKIPCTVAIVEGAPADKLRQMQAYGAHLFRVRGFGTDPTATEVFMKRLLAIATEHSAELQISAFRYSPVGMSAVQTIAFELAEQLETVDHVFTPAGGGGLALALARGFAGQTAAFTLEPGPAIHCVQPDGNDTIATPLRQGASAACPQSSTTEISGLQVGSVIDGNETLAACRASGGTGFAVSDREVFESQRRLAREEGIFCEPAAATALAGALRAVDDGRIDRESSIVCLVTGIGFKDGCTLDAMVAGQECPLIDGVGPISDYLATRGPPQRT